MSNHRIIRMASSGALLALLAGCQGLFQGEPDTSIGARRLAAAAPVRSSQRQDENGYPLLGAFPGTANQQLSPDQVNAMRGRLNQAARTAGAAAPPSTYAQQVERARELRKTQAAAVDKALAQPASKRKSGAPTPAEVLRQIEATGSQ